MNDKLSGNDNLSQQVDVALEQIREVISDENVPFEVRNEIRKKMEELLDLTAKEVIPEYVEGTSEPLVEKVYKGLEYEELLKLMEGAGLLFRGVKTPWAGGGYVWQGDGMRLKEEVFGGFGKMLDREGYEPFQTPRQLPKEIIEEVCKGVVDLEKGTYWLAVSEDGGLKSTGLYANSSNDAVVSYYLANLQKAGGKVLPFRAYSRHQIIRNHKDSINTKALINSDENYECNEAYSVQETAELCEREFEIIVEKVRRYFEQIGISFLTVDQSNWGNKPVAKKVTSLQSYAGPVRGSVRLATIYMHDDTFSRLFNLRTVREDGSSEYAHQVGYGLWEGLIVPLLDHLADKHGLCIPPRLAAKQMVFVPRNQEEEKKAAAIIGNLPDSNRAFIDTTYRKQFIKRLNKHVRNGIPLRITFGGTEGSLVVSRRDTLQTTELKNDDFVEGLPHILDSIHTNYVKRSREYADSHLAEAVCMDEINDLVRKQKLVIFNHCGADDCAIDMEQKLTGEFLGHVREFDSTGDCIGCGNPGKRKGLFGRRAPTP